MTVELPDEPKSRKEQYLADIAGQDVTLPAEPKSREEQYLAYIAENGGGGGGGGGTSNFDELTNRPKYNGTAMTGDTNIPTVPSVVQTAGTSTTDVMSQKATTDTIYTPKQISHYDNWGAIYIGNKDSSNNVLADPTTTPGDNTYFYGLPYQSLSGAVVPQNRTVCIMGNANGIEATAVGFASVAARNSIAFGNSAQAYSNYSTALGGNSSVSGAQFSVALGSYSTASRAGEVNIGTGTQNYGYNSTKYRVLGGVHDPIDAHDAATKGYVDANAGGALLLYQKSTQNTPNDDVYFYKDAGFTTLYTVGEIYDAVKAGKIINVIIKDQNESGSSTRFTRVITQTYFPATRDDEYISENGFQLYFYTQLSSTVEEHYYDTYEGLDNEALFTYV